MSSPSKFAHVVYRSNDQARLRDWYITALGAQVSYENEGLCFLTYDNEHHRIAIMAHRRFKERERGVVGVDHVAFAYPTLQALLGTHDRLRSEGIEPAWCVNHGPTTSFYYVDPDGNRVEFQVDNYDTEDELHDFFRSDYFAANPIGIEIDPDELRRRLADGEPEPDVRLRADVLADRRGDRQPGVPSDPN